MFQRRGEDEIKDMEPTKIKKTIHRSRDKKISEQVEKMMSMGMDDISAEMIKYSPKIVYQQTGDILNEIANTGNIPDEVVEGVLVPLPKPGKPQGPPANCRLVLLFSILRKILACCMIKRI